MPRNKSNKIPTQLKHSRHNAHLIEIRLRQFDVQSAMRRERRKSKQQLSSESEAFLWILTPTLGEEKLNLFKAEPSENWGKGIYFLRVNR